MKKVVGIFLFALAVGLTFAPDSAHSEYAGNKNPPMLSVKEHVIRSILLGVFPNESNQRSLFLKIIAIELTCGEQGKSVPVRVSYSLSNTNKWTPISASGIVNTGESYELTLANVKGELKFRAETQLVTGEFGWCPARSYDTGTDNSVILIDGDNIQNLIDQGILQRQFGNQVEIDTLLAKFLDQKTQEVDLGKNEMIVLMELGTDDPGSSAFDLQDLVFHIEVK